MIASWMVTVSAADAWPAARGGGYGSYSPTPRQRPPEEQLTYFGREFAVAQAMRGYDARAVDGIKIIIAEVAAKHGLTAGDLTSERRGRAFIPARFEAYYRARVETRRSLPAIGRAFNRDHTSVVHGIKRHCAWHGLPVPAGIGPQWEDGTDGQA